MWNKNMPISKLDFQKFRTCIWEIVSDFQLFAKNVEKQNM